MRLALLACLAAFLLPAAAAQAADTTDPTIEFGGPPSGTISGTVLFGTKPTDDTGVTFVRFYAGLEQFAVDETRDDGGFFTATLDTRTLEDGVYEFRQTAYDAAGNDASAFRTYTVDNTVAAPEFVAPSPGENTATSASSIQYTFTKPAEAVDTTCRINLGPPVPCSTSNTHTVDTSGLADGTYTLTVTVTDGAGNEAFAQRSFRLDRTAPTLTVSAPTGVINATTITPTTFSQDAGGSTPTLACALDGGSYGSCTDIAVSEGAHTLHVRATDDVGNARTVDTSFTVDRTLPTMSVTPTIAGNAVTLEWTASDATALTFTCRLDAGDFAPCTSGVQYGGLSSGPHSVTVRAQDAAGNARSVITGFTLASTGTTGGGGTTALPTRPKVTAPSKLSLKKAKRKLRLTVATTVPGCRLRLIKPGRAGAFVSRKILRAGTTKLTIRLGKRVRPGTYVLTLKCGSKTAKRKLKLTR